jgi:hypothetical protein
VGAWAAGRFPAADNLSDAALGVASALRRPRPAHLRRDSSVERYRATGSRLALRVAMAAGVVAVGRHHDPEIAVFLNFDWYSPQYRSYHTEDELRRWYGEAGFGDVRILPQHVSAIGRAN